MRRSGPGGRFSATRPYHPLQDPLSAAALLIVVASPVSLIISGFRGNTYPIMVAFLLLSLYKIETGPAWLARSALAMAVNTKIATRSSYHDPLRRILKSSEEGGPEIRTEPTTAACTPAVHQWMPLAVMRGGST
jgi:hypothetical protein